MSLYPSQKTEHLRFVRTFFGTDLSRSFLTYSDYSVCCIDTHPHVYVLTVIIIDLGCGKRGDSVPVCCALRCVIDIQYSKCALRY